MLEPQLVKAPKLRSPRQVASELDIPKDVTSAIVILSGGMDSAVTLAYAIDLLGKENVIALTFDYGQRHFKEMEAAKALAKHYGVHHIISRIDLRQIGGSALTDDLAVPDFKADEEAGKLRGVALTYVPMRNTIFIAMAAAYAEVHGCEHIYIGVNYIDSGGYPDCRPEFLDAINKAIFRGSRDKPGISGPLVRMTKAEIVKAGQNYGVPWEKTWSCYEGLDMPCGKCNACVQRAKGFAEAGVIDPLAIQKHTGQEEVQS